MNALIRGGTYRFRVFSDDGKSKIGEARNRSAMDDVHEYVIPFEVPMDHVTGVEVVETLSDIAQKSKSVGVWVILEVAQQVTTRNPIRNELMGSDGNAK